MTDLGSGGKFEFYYGKKLKVTFITSREELFNLYSKEIHFYAIYV
jgi:hypothetical protein